MAARAHLQVLVGRCDPELVDVVKARRLVASGRIYDITAAAQIGRRQGLELLTRAQVG
jgi:hypothetical protein